MGRVVADLSHDHLQAIEQAARDYFEGWFEGDPERLAKCLHPQLAKRNIDQPDLPDSPIDENDWDLMINGAREGRGTKYRGNPFNVTILDTTANMASVRVEGAPTSTCFTSVDSETPGVS